MKWVNWGNTTPASFQLPAYSFSSHSGKYQALVIDGAQMHDGVWQISLAHHFAIYPAFHIGILDVVYFNIRSQVLHTICSGVSFPCPVGMIYISHKHRCCRAIWFKKASQPGCRRIYAVGFHQQGDALLLRDGDQSPERPSKRPRRLPLHQEPEPSPRIRTRGLSWRPSMEKRSSSQQVSSAFPRNFRPGAGRNAGYVHADFQS